jgi:hypothetical protein
VRVRESCDACNGVGFIRPGGDWIKGVEARLLRALRGSDEAADPHGMEEGLAEHLPHFATLAEAADCVLAYWDDEDMDDMPDDDKAAVVELRAALEAFRAEG